MKYLVAILFLAFQSAIAQFQVGDSVMVGPQAINCTNIHSTASITGPVLKCELVGAVGKVLQGGTLDVNNSSNDTFYQVFFSDGFIGWADGKNLIKIGSTIIYSSVPTATFTASPSTVSSSSTKVTFKWTTQNATYVGIAGWTGNWNLNDSTTATFLQSTVVTLVAGNDYGIVQVPLTITMATPVIGFAVGVIVSVNVTRLNVRSAPSLTDNYPIGTETGGHQGVITTGPTVASGLNWWKIKWDDGKIGWSADAYLDAIAALPPLSYPSVANQYDSLLINTEADIDSSSMSKGFLSPILIQGIYIRKGCADTTVNIVPMYLVIPNPMGVWDTTYIQGTYHFTKPRNSVER